MVALAPPPCLTSLEEAEKDKEKYAKGVNSAGDVVHAKTTDLHSMISHCPVCFLAREKGARSRDIPGFDVNVHKMKKLTSFATFE